MPSQAVDFNNIGTSVVPPAKLAHVVLYTHDLERLKKYWTDFLGAKVQMEKPSVLAFITYDQEHHRVGFVQRDDRPAKAPSTLAHVAFGMPSLQALLLSYRQRRTLHGTAPKRCTNHGVTVSLYYEDPDGNELEVFHDCFGGDNDPAARADAFLASPAFQNNPLGLAFDPDDWIRRLEAGEDEAEIMRYGAEGEAGDVDWEAAVKGSARKD